MTYSTTTIRNIFDSLYSKLRRQYAQYAKNYIEKQFFVFANIALKRSFRVPYYLNKTDAFVKSTPAGYLAMDISPYYFKERPIFYNRPDREFIDAFMSNGNPDLSYFQPAFVLNVFINNEYTDVFINHDDTIMDVNVYVQDAGAMAGNEASIKGFNAILQQNIRNIQVAYNQSVLLLGNPRYNDSDGFVKYYKGYLENELSRYQVNASYTIKVCKDCGNSAILAGTETPGLIVLAAAPSLLLLTKNFSQQPAALEYQNNFYANSLPDMQELIKRYKAIAVVNAQPNYNTVKEGQYTILPSATIQPKPFNYWWLVAALGAGYLFTKKN
ncbi:MAG: hypothetical protein ABIQ88_02390 [Chitinophagaceae bacterium]